MTATFILWVLHQVLVGIVLNSMLQEHYYWNINKSRTEISRFCLRSIWEGLSLSEKIIYVFIACVGFVGVIGVYVYYKLIDFIDKRKETK